MAQWENELEELMARRSRALVGYAYTLTRDRVQAEDLVQDALVKVFSRLRRPRGMDDDGGHVMDLDRDQPVLTNAEAYVRRTMLTIYLDRFRRQRNWTGIKHLLADEDRVPAAEGVATARVDVGVALAQLSPRQREAVVLRFFEDMTVPQIAQTLGTSPGTIKRHLFNAMELLRGSLAEIAAPEMDTSFEERLGAVSGSVRRRRAVKVGALSGASLVLAGLLAMAALWGPARLLSEPVVPATQSPDAAVGGGWVPSAWEEQGPQYECGMEVTELTSTSDRVRLELTGDVRPSGYGLEAHVRVTRTDKAGLALDGGAPLLVFAQNGQVVDLGQGWHEGGYVIPEAGDTKADVATASAATACGDWTSGAISEEYLDARPAGTYEVYAVMPWFEPASDDGAGQMAVSEPVTMEVPEVELPGEAPLTVDIRDGYQPEWLEGTDLTCGAHASDIPAGPQVPRIRSGLELTAQPAGSADAPDEKVRITFTETKGEAVDTTRTPFALVWLREGRVVGFGHDIWSEPAERLHVDAKGEASVVVPVEPDTTCLTHPEAGLPDGSYDVYAFTELDPGSDDEPQYVAVEAALGYFIGD
ncbi:RNA polymerase sigma factor (sigma-70 family) [Promicromonospora sp. AC04]|uniref:RNA polymerase sigma factor n=1 Tax=Promicromonospora sp. AC04 TaxID=2135723 RepID=UPI000D33B307|nr:sigma-70 family RNA polymerase sigma factor [Promicromonospora sp. AC04]PUB24042.1 RNA polymerase sigma factor (sigma-70 family) [Promicromonospora sp. AC04]